MDENHIMSRLVIFFALLSVATSQISFFGGEVEEEDNSCTTPHGKPGECIGLRQCGNVLALLKKPIPDEVIGYLRKSVCSFTGFLPDVCCPEEKPTFGGEESTPPPQPQESSWSSWSPYSSCTVTCGGGTQSRTRACTPEGECQGEGREERECSTDPCGEGGTVSQRILIKIIFQLSLVAGVPGESGAHALRHVGEGTRQG